MVTVGIKMNFGKGLWQTPNILVVGVSRTLNLSIYSILAIPTAVSAKFLLIYRTDL